MKRPYPWITASTGLSLAALALAGFAFLWLLPRYLGLYASTVLENPVHIGGMRYVFPATLALDDLDIPAEDARGQFRARSVLVSFEGLDWRERLLWFDVTVDHPTLRVTRKKEGGVVLPLRVNEAFLKSMKANRGEKSLSFVALKQLRIDGGIVEFIDENLDVPFRALLDHIYAVIGPFASRDAMAVRFAQRATFVGFEGHDAPAYCSGWFDAGAGDLEASCYLEPLAMAAFHPYYKTFNKIQVREYQSTLELTGEWYARNFALERHFQIVLGELVQGDVSVRGRTFLDFKNLTQDQIPEFAGEFSIENPPNEAGVLDVGFHPANNIAKAIVAFMHEWGKRSLGVRFFGVPVEVALNNPVAGQDEHIRQVMAAHKQHLARLIDPFRRDIVLNPPGGGFLSTPLLPGGSMVDAAAMGASQGALQPAAPSASSAIATSKAP